jgi:hypothetical protein
MKTVSFTRMEDGTEEDYLLLQKLEKPYVAMTADRIMRELMHQAEDTLSGYQLTRLGHARQVAPMMTGSALLCSTTSATGWRHKITIGLPQRFFARSCVRNAYGWSSTMHRFR